MPPRILVFAGSIRTGAWSGLTADAAARELAALGASVTRISLADYPMPIMDEDLQREQGIPKYAMALGRMIAGHDGMLIASPEYNASIPPLLKNAIDWVSRISEDEGKPLKPYAGKVAALCSSSTGKFAGIRCINHLRAVLVNLGLQVVSQQCSIGEAALAFEADGTFRDERSVRAMRGVCEQLIEQSRMLSRGLEPVR
jgi:NAD(P)H-dependent FMN reductase